MKATMEAIFSFILVEGKREKKGKLQWCWYCEGQAVRSSCNLCVFESDCSKLMRSCKGGELCHIYTHFLEYVYSLSCVHLED